MNTYDLISIIISVVALTFSLYSIIKTNLYNKYELLIENSEYEQFYKYQRVFITIFNNSNKSIQINRIEFYKNKQPISPINLDIQKYYDNQRNLKNESIKNKNNIFLDMNSMMLAATAKLDLRPETFEYPSDTKSIIIAPNDREKLTLYFDRDFSKITIKIYANHKISIFSKHKSFPILLNKID